MNDPRWRQSGARWRENELSCRKISTSCRGCDPRWRAGSTENSPARQFLVIAEQIFYAAQKKGGMTDMVIPPNSGNLPQPDYFWL